MSTVTDRPADRTATITAPEGQPTVTIVREFAAPVDKVWRAMTEPDLIAQWMGPDDLTTTVEEYDVAHGGRYRFVHTAPDGSEYAFRGVHHGPQTPALSMRTFEFEAMPGHVTLEWQTIDDLGDGTCRVTGTSSFMSVEDRDGMVASGMEVGVQQGYAKLDRVLEGL